MKGGWVNRVDVNDGHDSMIIYSQKKSCGEERSCRKRYLRGDGCDGCVGRDRDDR